MANMEKVHSEALAAKEEEISARINKAVVCGLDCFDFEKEPVFLTVTLFVLLLYLGTMQRGVCPASKGTRTAGLSGSGGCRVAEDSSKNRS